MTANDHELLRQFIRDGAQTAFTALVQRHVNLVYSAALRQVRSPHLAEEVAQSVFADLARDAAKLKPDTNLTAWLYEVARRSAIDVVRKESRRQLREQIAMEMNTMNATANDWTQIEPLLDDAMAALNQTDRTAVLLRYFENKSLTEIGLALGTSDDAAQKRVSRAIDQLREFFTERRVTIGASGLVVLISANAVQAAPAGLAATIATTTLAGAAITTSTAVITAKTIAMTTLQKIAVITALAIVTGAGVYQARQAAQLREEVRALQDQQIPLNEEIQRLGKLLNNATNQIADLNAEKQQLSRTTPELLKLRGENTRLRNDASLANDPFVQQALVWKANEAKLRKLFADHPEQGVPELALVSDEQWFSIAKNADLDSEAGIRKAQSEVRETAKNNFMPDLSSALEAFVKANNGLLPTDLDQLQPFFKQPVAEAILQQYKLTATGKYTQGFVVSDKGVIDPEYDYPWKAGPNGYGPDATALETAQLTAQMEILKPAVAAYAAANQGAIPAGLSQLKPYITTSELQAAFDKLTKNGVDTGKPQ